MAKVIIVYGSTMGNTETLSKSVEEGLKGLGMDVLVKNVVETKPEELKNYDAIVLGCSTWGDGELQDDFIEFESKMNDLILTGKKAACFGPGDNEMYADTFCMAVDILEDRLKKCGAEIVVDSLKIDGDVEPGLEKAKEWGKQIGQMLEK